MTTRVYLAFDIERDLSRAEQLRRSAAADGVEAAGFFDRSEYEEARRRRGDAIARAIGERLEGTAGAGGGSRPRSRTPSASFRWWT